MNPIGKTPVLELDDGLAISESTAITEYLDNLDGSPTLTGRTPAVKNRTGQSLPPKDITRLGT